MSARGAPTSSVNSRSSTSSVDVDVARDSDAQPDLFIEGQRYVWVKKLAPFDPTQAEFPRTQGPPPKLIADMSIEELAAKLRPVLHTDGHEYILDHDPIEAAIRTRTMASVVERTEGYHPPGVPVSVPELENSGIATPEFIIGGDNRVSYDHHFAGISWPAMTYLNLQDVTCTATTIGLRTAVFAGHCFRFNWPGRSVAFASDTSFSKPIPDVSTIQDSYRVRNCIDLASASATVNVNLTHSYIGDISIYLKYLIPGGSPTTLTLRSRSGGSASGTFNLSFAVTLPTTRNLNYTLVITDSAYGDSGTLNNWSVSRTPTLTTSPQRCSGEFGLFEADSNELWYPAGLFPSDGSTDWQFDYAFLRYPAATFSNWGHVGTSTSSGDRNGQAMMVWGYPDQRPMSWPSGYPQTIAGSGYPRLSLKQGTINTYGGYFASSLMATRQAFIHDLDIFNGDSGAGLLTSAVELAAIQSTQWNGVWTGIGAPPMTNEARRWDSAVTSFYTAVFGSTPY